MLVKIIGIVLIARLLDGLIVFFSRKLRKGQKALRVVLLSFVTIATSIYLILELPLEPSLKVPQGNKASASQYGETITNGIAKQQRAIQIAKAPYLKGKRLAVIGDSITELDGHEAAQVGTLVGYQNAFRKAGATVATYGYGGATYSLYDKKISASQHVSIYDKIVTDKVGFKDIDIVTLFAGTNDVGRGYSLGKSTELEPKTAIGGLKGIIEYIQKANPETQIFIFTPIKRVGPQNDEKLGQLADEIIKVGASYQLPVANLFLTSGITLANQREYLYDGLHPNNQGMALIGQKMVDFIEDYGNE